jgi:hypothetical protein
MRIDVSRKSATARNKKAGAASKRARKSRGRRGGEPSEEAAGQAASIVDHDP